MQGAYDMRGLDDLAAAMINSPCSYWLGPFPLMAAVKATDVQSLAKLASALNTH
jgi:hypothetical protein